MIRISLAYLYETGAAFGKLADLTSRGGDVKLISVWTAVSGIHSRLVALYGGGFYKDNLIVSRSQASDLFELCEKYVNRTDYETVVDFMELYNLQEAVRQFETILKAELGVMDAYFVTKKGGYDTLKLVTDAAVLFPPTLGTRAPEALPDIAEAGKCLAFELGTAAGFHLLRACEAVLRHYWDRATGKKPRPTNRNIGAYLQKMTKLGVGDAKVLAVLTQIKDLHRNTLVHPEDSLTLEEAISLLGIVRSAISAMLTHLPDVVALPVAPTVPAIPASTATPTP